MTDNEKREINLFTIGFAKKSARLFFSILKNAKIKNVIDIRLKNESQLAGFTKKDDLAYFLEEICTCGYRHELLLSPTEEILNAYKQKNISWIEYKNRFENLLKERQAHKIIDSVKLDNSCLLCSEPTPEKCHRRLVAEYLKSNFNNINIIHL